MYKKTVCVVGLGYIGLPTAAVLAGNGYRVFGVDIDRHAVDTINRGLIHIVEPGLDEHVKSAVLNGSLKAFSEPQLSDIYMLCVPTPFHEGGGVPVPNVDFVLSAVDSISRLIKKGDIVILESTSPVGTTNMVAERLLEQGIDLSSVFVAYCPERVLPGNIMVELVENDRVVGGYNQASTIAVRDFYKTFVEGTVIESDARTAEMCKLTENSFRDVNIAFANELSIICEKEGINVWDLIELANKHPRVNILQPGPGVGGHCIAVDPWFIVSQNLEEAKIIRNAREINNYKTKWVIEKMKTRITEFLRAHKRKPKVACFGLAFKPDIDDLRESPAVLVAEGLHNESCELVVVEPNITEHDRFTICTIQEALLEVDLVVLLVKHRQFLEEAFLSRLKLLEVEDFCGVTQI